MNENDEPSHDPAVVMSEHRGLRAQQDADARRLRSDVRADQNSVREDQASLERDLFSGPATTWPQAAEKACYHR